MHAKNARSNLSYIAVTKEDNLECLARVLAFLHDDSLLAVVIKYSVELKRFCTRELENDYVR